MTTSAQVSRATSTGMFRTWPPSARTYLSHVGPQQVVDAARVGQSAGRDDAAVLYAQIDARTCPHLEPLLLDGFQRPATDTANDGLPVDARQESLQVGGRHAGRIARTDECTHARAGDAVDRHVQFLEHLEHADVGAALGAATGEYETDPRPVT
jgi:hypothetical protein